MWLRGTQCCRCEKEKEKTKTDAKKKTHPLRLSIDHQPAQGQIAHGVQRLCAEIPETACPSRAVASIRVRRFHGCSSSLRIVIPTGGVEGPALSPTLPQY
jgi:hypothetical protein